MLLVRIQPPQPFLLEIILKYCCPEEATKAGFIPLVEEEFIELLPEWEIVSDGETQYQPGSSKVRVRLTYHNDNWYVWRTDIQGRHECFRLNTEPLPMEIYNKYRYIFEDIDKFRV